MIANFYLRAGLLTGCAVSLFLVSCGDLMKVPTIRPKADPDAEIVEDGGDGSLMAGMGSAKIKDPNLDVAVGSVKPTFGGYLPSSVGEGVVIDGVMITPDDQIVWSDPENPEKEIKFGDAFAGKPKKKKLWHSNLQEARRESQRSGKPILLWFTRSGTPGSPMCKTLNRELFATHEFNDWAKEKVVRLKVDIRGGSEDRGAIYKGPAIYRKRYAEKLKKQFHILGTPTVLVLQPDGSVYSRERGFQRAEKKSYWRKLKNASLTIEHNRNVWERKMASKGYRRWTGKNKQIVFAKLAHYSSGNLVLVEPDGTRFKTTTEFLSKGDVDWILKEKAKYER